MKKLILAVIILFSSISVTFGAMPNLFFDVGVNYTAESSETYTMFMGGTLGFGFTFAENVSVIANFTGGPAIASLKDSPFPGDSKDFSTFLVGLGIEYCYHFERFGVFGEISVGYAKKDYQYYDNTGSLGIAGATIPFTNHGFYGKFSLGVSFIVTQHIEPFVRFNYIMCFMDYNTTAWPIDSDIGVQIGLRINIFKNQYIDKGY